MVGNAMVGVWRMAWWPHIALPHAAAVVGGVAQYILTVTGTLRV